MKKLKKLKSVLVLALVFALLAGLQPTIAAPQPDVPEQQPAIAVQRSADINAEDIYSRLADSKASTLSVPDGAKVQGNRIIVKLNEGYMPEWKNYGLTVDQDELALSKRNIYVVNAPEGADVASIARQLSALPGVEYAQPDYVYEMDIEPNDEYYPNQWGLKKINAPKAWGITQGSAKVTVAVLDTGVDARHPDLKDRVLEGYDFVNNDSYPSDDNGHGTMVAGVIAAVANNGTGIAGVDRRCKILPVKVATADGYFYSSDVIEGIYYAVDGGADVINMSFGGELDVLADRPVSEALLYAGQKGVLLVAASGNEGTAVSFPALYAPVIAVGAGDEQDVITDFSNHGPPLDVAAPGVNIYTTYSDGRKATYASADGTSLAAPFVSAAASLLLAKDPDLTPAEVEYLIESSAAKPASMAGDEWNEYYGYGRLDAYAALKQELPDLSADVPDDLQQAEMLYAGKGVSQRVDMPTDLDCYKVEVTSSGSVKVAVDAPPNLDMAAAVYDGGGNLLDVFDNAPVGRDEIFSFAARTGTYYIVLLDVNLHWSAEPYGVSVSGPVKTSQRPDAVGGQPASNDLYLNSYYAISSYNEKDYASKSDQVALAWGEIRQNNSGVYFSQRKKENGKQYDYGVPEGNIQSLVDDMRDGGAKLMLSVFMDDKDIADALLASPDKVIAQMTEDFGIKYYDYYNGTYSYVLDEIGGAVEYDGIIVDFEGLTSENRARFNAFLEKLSKAMPGDKLLGVCVQPYYDGYDYSHIGRVADQVILMAHDYQLTRAAEPASAPYPSVRKAVEQAVAYIPPQKILLQVSMAPVQWQAGSYTPVTPTYSAMQNALASSTVDEVTPIGYRYDSKYGVGYAYLKRQKADGTYIEDEFFYEDKKSITSKTRLAEEFGLKGISIWRLGLGATDLMDYMLGKAVPSERLSGTDRYTTAAAVSRRGWPVGADAAVLVSGKSFADALAGTTLAYAKDAPVLLTDPYELSDAAADELYRLGVKKVYILGGTGAVSKAVEGAVKSMGISVERIWGSDRYKTAVAIGQYIQRKSGTALIATGYNFADALAAAPFCAAKGIPILFADKDDLNEDTRAALKAWGITDVLIAGDTGAVPAAAEYEINAMGIQTKRLAGPDRYATAVEIANHFGKTGFSEIMLATGGNFPDALSGAAFAAQRGMPIILVPPRGIKDEVVDYAAQSRLARVYVAGGTGAVSDAALKAVTLPYK
ncbi:S8 family serine peptidase [Mahella australiensis]|uniref:Peptidase S8 and S53 subtilisin kexin sedolisin n=1 Tax=Mahella australiensis (strain DSM 15567 / CIP 107919 / 50-1 BON) TaxID=697281 RepID=F3ZWL3_MAHA5|nr:S8 family serine peptidase [Mahella australiensis]AEE95448.1 peptidase S8 and S53 subtilisin kexin sedolisin [Mahella australiensis 50-1 BON]